MVKMPYHHRLKIMVKIRYHYGLKIRRTNISDKMEMLNRKTIPKKGSGHVRKNQSIRPKVVKS